MKSKTVQSEAPPAVELGSLASDIARCDGYGSIEDGVRHWREGCETCLRRTAKRPDVAVMMSPPEIISFECEYLIEPNDQAHLRRREAVADNPKDKQ